MQLSMHSVEVEGYGAFTDAVVYPLKERGVCAVVGDNRDDGCSDSNGAGKTTLVMAAMWALTGNSDLRIEGGAGKTLTKTDVVNDYAKTARVRLEGAAFRFGEFIFYFRAISSVFCSQGGAEGEPDQAARAEVRRRRRGAHARGLQADPGGDGRGFGRERRGANRVSRAAHRRTTFRRQRRALKAALGELVDADTWQEAKDLSRKRVTAARKRATALGADASARADYVRRIEQRLHSATAAANDWTAQVERNLSRLASEEAGAADALARARRGGRRRRRAEGGERAVGRGGGGRRRGSGRRVRVLGPSRG